MIRFLVALVALAWTAVDAAAEPEMTFKISNVRAAPAAQFRELMTDARAKVRAWWGPTFEETISVETEDKRGPSMALIPAWRGERGRMLFSAYVVDRGEAATHHEMIHVYAPNASRFLAEGLATYGHDLVGGKPAYPNMGRDLDTLAANHVSMEVMMKLERVPTPTPLEQTHPHGYVLAASFMKFMIERHGMERFKALYALTPLEKMQRNPGDPARWRQVYGEDYAALVKTWMAALPKRPPAAPLPPISKD